MPCRRRADAGLYCPRAGAASARACAVLTSPRARPQRLPTTMRLISDLVLTAEHRQSCDRSVATRRALPSPEDWIPTALPKG